ncbi:transcriptional regulator [Paractinoplanes abujensis]|uniref:DNA-binding transcriptional ArsR family regulator n=1 Tax=Paractinoplanes abujensis TaxID=882441 RepID=A0A7W7CL41_9ACTN|nr:metalloregulator ArsR/SmtB family transcription factor [Actinoplanes abujensis]MBB4690539.1 DNA-binding transcriptional ArsR family regulator [Actinoplanes abujensis]GID24910.1 transcriptional regulator [Actinoplanes abujensis]
MTESIDGVFAALADPTRRAILDRLATGDATAGELAANFPISAQAVSKHLNVLEAAGLIVRTREAQRRWCRIVPGQVQAVAQWAEQYRRLWEQRYDALDDYLGRLQPGPTKEEP